MSARDRILQNVRHGLGGSAARDVTKSDWIKTTHAPIPAIARRNGSERTTQFLNNFEQMHGTYSKLKSFDELPAMLSQQLRERNIGQSVRMGPEPDFSTLDWSNMDVSVGPGRLVEPATLTRAFCASSETGTLMLLSGAKNPVTLNFLGETHFVALKSSEIEAGFEGMWSRWRASGHTPRTVNLITGPSRTADIEQSLELGAHGALAVHLFLVDDLDTKDAT